MMMYSGFGFADFALPGNSGNIYIRFKHRSTQKKRRLKERRIGRKSKH